VQIGEKMHPNDLDFDCPHCGAMANYEMTSCPECGQSFYPLDEDTQPADDDSSVIAWISSLVAVGISWLVAAAVTFILFSLFSRWITLQPITIAGQIFLSAASLLGALVGGFIIGRAADHHPVQHSLATAVLVIGNSILLESYWRTVTLANLVTPAIILTWALIILVVLASAGILNKTISMSQSIVRGTYTEDDLYWDLLLLIGIDQSAADRLVEYERSQNPNAKPAELIKKAIERLERDRK
jgi:hypothetical protein